MSRCSRVVVIVALVALLAACSGTKDGSTDPRNPSDRSARLDERVTVEGVTEHLENLAEIAATSGGTRASGTPGYARSARYVRDRLVASGYAVTFQRFGFPFFRVSGTGSVTLADKEGFREGADFKAMIYSAAGQVEAPIRPLGTIRDPGQRDGPGCNASAYDRFPAGAIVLLRPGPCFYRDQVEVAQDAGAVAVIFAMPTYERGAVLRPTLLTPASIEVPVLAASNEMGLELFARAGDTAIVRSRVINERRTTMNVIAELPGSDDDGVVMSGGHLDSVIDGPGINDNASGVAALLEVAEELSEIDAEAPVRFAFWSAEELGLLGSTAYVERLSSSDRNAIEAYLNFDMLASRNFVVYIYDDPGVSEGSQHIHDLFESYFSSENIPATDIDLEGRSDHGPFIEAGIAVGGLFTGADMIKTDREEERFGGVAGDQQDPCYHLACDDIENVDLEVLGQMTAAFAHVLQELTLEGTG